MVVDNAKFLLMVLFTNIKFFYQENKNTDELF